MPFTYYGDLLGISGFYKLSPQIAHQKLSDFYNTTFLNISDEFDVIMFSDSLLIRGDDSKQALWQLHKLYTLLIHEGLLLRGAMVSGRLEFDPRITRDNFQKYLPANDYLAKAVGLENTQKGSRLLIENALANKLLNDHPQWLTHQGYVRNVANNNYRLDYNDILRRICPTPDGYSYECLYFWICSGDFDHDETDYRKITEELKNIKNMLRKDIALHYKETIELLNRCKHRQNYTKRKMML